VSLLWTAWLVAAACAVVDWYAVARGHRAIETWAKPATLVALIAAAALGGAPDTTAGRWLLLALVFGLVGDVFLLGRSTARFRAGLGAFLVGHLAYLACFVAVGLDQPLGAAAGGVVALGALVATRDVLPTVHRSDGPALSGPVAVYMLVITAMVVLAWATGDWLVSLGASVFVASDATLAVNRFVRALPGAAVVVMVTYHVGQALIVLGVLAA
jgi:uncharacterized membrane protein YhhN